MTSMNKKQQKKRNRIICSLAFFVLFEAMDLMGLFDRIGGQPWVELAAFLVPYLIAGYDVLAKAWHGIVHKQPFDEHLLMAIATIGAFALVFFPEAEPHMAEGAAVMIFYQVGSLFESYAVGKTRSSISEMMDIAPEFANVMQNGQVEQVDPAEVPIGSQIVCKPGERIPLDGVVVSGQSQLDTSALTGESLPSTVAPGATVASGCVNLSGALTIQTTSAYEDSTVQRVLDLVENASEKKARSEAFITRFARYYTPVVVGLAVLIAVVSPLLFGFTWTQGVQSALVFLVVSCPCALVISVPLSFFGGVGAASRQGILVKGSTFLEALAQVVTVAFDKTGTLTDGTFGVIDVKPVGTYDADELLRLAAHTESLSGHPIAQSVVRAYPSDVDPALVDDVQEHSGQGVIARVESHRVAVGNDKLMAREGIAHPTQEAPGTVLHVAVDGAYWGCIVVADTIKSDAQEAICSLYRAGIRKTVMLTGDREQVAAAVAQQLGISEYHAQLMPQDKVTQVETLLAQLNGDEKLAFAGDGINDAPVLMRADVGIAMGALGSDVAIEAADIVLMDDKPSHIARAVAIARKTLRIVRQNIAFALGVKAVIMILALPWVGIATMWLAVFGDVGVSVLAILNAMRCLRA